MVTKSKMRSANKKNAFTLIEVLISIVLLGIIFTYLYSVINSVKKENVRYIKKSDFIKQETQLFRLFDLDITQAVGKFNIINNGRFDIVQFKTKHSIYGIIEPTVLYFVSKKEDALIRVESLDGFALYDKDQLSKSFLYADILSVRCKSFKVLYTKAGFVNLMLRTKKLKPMVLKIPTVS